MASALISNRFPSVSNETVSTTPCIRESACKATPAGHAANSPSQSKNKLSLFGPAVSEVSPVVVRYQFVILQGCTDRRHDYHPAVKSAIGAQRDDRATVFQPMPRPAVSAVYQLRVDGAIVIRRSPDLCNRTRAENPKMIPLSP